MAHTEIVEQIAGITTDKNAKIHLHCGSGGRAGKTKSTLEKLEYTNVTNEGGYKDVIQRRN